MSNQPKLYRLLEEGEPLYRGDVTTASSSKDELRDVPDNWIGKPNPALFVILRPVAPTCWLPIGEKREFEREIDDIILFGTEIDKGRIAFESVGAVRRDCDTHYYIQSMKTPPPLPVLDGVKELQAITQMVKDIFDTETDDRIIVDFCEANPHAYKTTLEKALKHISELEEKNKNLQTYSQKLESGNAGLLGQVLDLQEQLNNEKEVGRSWFKSCNEAKESLRKAEEINNDISDQLIVYSQKLEAMRKSLPTWKKLNEFEGEYLPKGIVYIAKESTKLVILGSNYKVSELISLGWSHYHSIPEFKPDNSERIGELKKEIDSYEDSLSCQLHKVEGTREALKKTKAELAKLKEGGK